MTHARKPFALFRAGIVLPIFAFLALPMFGQSAEEPVITMTVSGGDVTFRLASPGAFTITWGDGELKIVTYWDPEEKAFDEGGGTEVSHSYGRNIQSARVKIEGEITGLDCSETSVTAIDTSKNPALEYLRCDGTDMNAAAALACFKSLPDRAGESEAGQILCGLGTACGEEAHAIARAKGWEVDHR